MGHITQLEIQFSNSLANEHVPKLGILVPCAKLESVQEHFLNVRVSLCCYTWID